MLRVRHRDVHVQPERRLAPRQLAHRRVEELVAGARRHLDVLPQRERVRARDGGAHAERLEHVERARARRLGAAPRRRRPTSACGSVASSSAEPCVSAARPLDHVRRQRGEHLLGARGEVPRVRVEQHDLLLDARPSTAPRARRDSSRPSAPRGSCRAHLPRSARQASASVDQLAEQRAVLGAVDERLGVPLHAEVERGPSLSRPSTIPSGAHATARSPRPSRSAAWWWKELTSASVTPITRASREPGSIRTEWVVTRPRAVWRCSIAPSVGRDVLVQRAAARDVERLHAAADAEHRHPARVGELRERELVAVERRARWSPSCGSRSSSP